MTLGDARFGTNIADKLLFWSILRGGVDIVFNRNIPMILVELRMAMMTVGMILQSVVQGALGATLDSPGPNFV